ncbi:Lipoprotein-releasing system ATP-binding protein LolD [Flavobacterium psychrophilum]|nr:Lipoprotein releasing system ATP-binding protein lolD [Flavobacterium psychrophilum]SCY25563.1 lipoprotein-releasing system ATP-binding protein [Flavobacterium psychrophilum DSM 3660] [Flavobacterium psychrophilum DSM 3660 = ATCC 49418]SNA31362.1 Probable ABC-type transport system, ATPase component [Flavobacterium psychrophilum]SNA64956.1 Lipoprotein-releasing system ATP-binding protein LolD [Flavobacterium psychrophilum]SNA67227.1 Lipoprotein-releasing system ATP-binding protein LolD [Flavo
MVSHIFFLNKTLFDVQAISLFLCENDYMIKATNIQKNYDTLQVLKGVNLHIEKGEIISIVGASGAGKTTLLQILGTLDKPSENKDSLLEINGQNVLKMNDKDLSKFRNLNLGFIFQFHQLLPEFTALENVCIPAFIAHKSKAETEIEAKKILTYLGLEHRIKHKPSELSGGEQQRVAVARALINKPAIIFADEPSGNLDTASAENLHQLFFKLRDELGQTFVIVTHNEELANMADRKLIMVDGNIKN